MKKVMLQFLAALLPAAFAPGAEERPPNVVIVFADDLGYGDIGCFGAKDVQTPNIDRLGAEGLRLTSFYVAQAVCSASRAALLTGCYPNRIGISGALGPRAKVGIGDGETTLAELLKSRGYTCGIYGKWHLGDAKPFLPLQHGFDDYLGLPYSNDMWPRHPEQRERPGRPGGYPDLPLIDGNGAVGEIRSMDEQAALTTRYTERAVAFIEKSKDRPFFLYLPHSMPHAPIAVSEKFRGHSGRGLYGDVIEEIDWSVGQVLKALDRTGVASNTLVLFTSDNGPWLRYGNHAGSAGPLREGKGTMFEGGCREPFVMRWPGRIRAGRVSDAIVASVDLLPTLAAITGARLPGHKLDGMSQLPLLLDEAAAPPRNFNVYFYLDELIAYREGRWKYFFPFTAGQYQEGHPAGRDGTPAPARSKRFEQPMLFDLDSDPGERRDVIAGHPDIAERLKQLGLGYARELRANRRPPGRLAPEQ